jgi:hypothetical protein
VPPPGSGHVGGNALYSTKVFERNDD